MIISGGAAIDPDIISGMQDFGFEVLQGYGLTECAPILALNRDVYYNNNSAGLALPGVEVKIENPDEDGIGEICGRGPNVMLGYYQDEEQTALAIDEDGFFHTGDYGYIDSDGFVIITGRKANMIVTKNGKNIFPEEIEFLLCQSDWISEAVVYSETNDRGDLIVAAMIYPDPETVAADPDTAGEALDSPKVYEKIMGVVRDVNHKLVAYKYVRKVGLRSEEFEKTTSKKIKRKSF